MATRHLEHGEFLSERAGGVPIYGPEVLKLICLTRHRFLIKRLRQYQKDLQNFNQSKKMTMRITSEHLDYMRAAILPDNKELRK